VKNKKVVIIAIVGLIIAFVVGSSMYKTNQAEKISALTQENAKVLQRDYSLTLGEDNAKVQLVEFFDPACETCAQMHPYVKDILKKNKGKIQLVMRYAPFHPNSDKIVVMLEAARLQGKFWETLELTFASQQYWASHHQPKLAVLWKFLPQAGLDMERLVEDMKNPKFQEIVKQDLADAKTLGAKKTPSYFVNGKPLQVFGLQQLIDLIDSEL